MSSKNILTASIVVPVTLGFAGLLYYASQKPKTDAEKHIEQVKQNPDSNLIYNPKNPKFLTFGGSTRTHKKGTKHTKKQRKN
jgi:hypothetical protein